MTRKCRCANPHDLAEFMALTGAPDPNGGAEGVNKWLRFYRVRSDWAGPVLQVREARWWGGSVLLRDAYVRNEGRNPEDYGTTARALLKTIATADTERSIYSKVAGDWK